MTSSATGTGGALPPVPTGVRRVTAAALAVVGLAALLVAGAGLLAPPAGVDPDSAPTGRGAGAEVLTAAGRRDPAATAAALQARLRRLPGDWNAWASLGTVYVEQARLSADPSYYGRAEGALRRSLRLRPEDNPGALTGLGALAAARHDFAGAREHAEAALAVDPFDSAALGVLTDALVELGRYDAAADALQRMLDLDPGVPALTRASYLFELRGETDRARTALDRALAAAVAPGDVAFAQQYLGELAFNAGDLKTAAARFDDGLRRLPDGGPGSVPLLAGRARVLAARGQPAAALEAWQQVVTRLPQPAYLVEYGDLLASVGRQDEAARQYGLVAATQRLFRAAGANVDLELARFEADRGRGAAAAAAARAEWQRRRSVDVEDAYAWALHAAGRDAEALRHARAAGRLGTPSALFAYHRGMIERALGRDDDARRSLARALRLNPHFSPLHAPLAERALAELGGRP